MKIETIFLCIMLCIVTLHSLVNASTKDSADLFDQIKSLNEEHHGVMRFCGTSMGKIIVHGNEYKETVTLAVSFDQAVNESLLEAYSALDTEHGKLICEKSNAATKSFANTLWITFMDYELIQKAKELAFTTR